MATVPIHVNQVECHPFLPQRPLLDFCTQHKIVLTAYSPLGSSDAPARTESDPSLLSSAKIGEIAAKYDKSAAQVLIRFHVQRGVVAIPKSKTPKCAILLHIVTRCSVPSRPTTPIAQWFAPLGPQRFCTLDVHPRRRPAPRPHGRHPVPDARVHAGTWRKTSTCASS